jgi:hypothetical protein
MLDFNMGDRVSFQPQGQPTQFGIVVRYNQKTVTVITESGVQWRVAPALLSKIQDLNEAQPHESTRQIPLRLGRT